jgi:hypothetical protein
MRTKYLSAVAALGKTSAVDQTLAKIGAEFGIAAEINDFKLRVQHIITMVPHHRAIRARYGAWAERLSHVPLCSAIRLVDHWYYRERRKLEWGEGSRLTFTVLRELRLILRLMRRDGRACQFQTYIEDVLS